MTAGGRGLLASWPLLDFFQTYFRLPHRRNFRLFHLCRLGTVLSAPSAYTTCRNVCLRVPYPVINSRLLVPRIVRRVLY